MATIGKVRQGLLDTDTVTTVSISAGAITTSKIANFVVTTEKYALSSVTTDILALTAVGIRHLQPGSVTTQALGPGAVTTQQIAPSAVTADMLAASAVRTIHLEISAVTWDKVAADAIRTANIQLSAITTDLLALTAVHTKHINISAVTWDKLALGSVRAQNFSESAGVLLGYRNAIINGSMQIFQRNLNSQVNSNTPAYSAADRFFAYQTGTAQVRTSRFALSTYTPGLTGFNSCMQWFRSVGDAQTGTTFVGQVLESIHSVPFQSGPVTLSFYAKAGNNFSGERSALDVMLITGTGTDQDSITFAAGTWSNSFAAISSRATLTTDWQRYDYTTYLRPDVMQIGVLFDWTPVGTAGADDSVYITGIQLERSPVATTFEHRSISTELELCERYFEKSYGLNVFAGDTIGSNVSQGRLRQVVQGLNTGAKTIVLPVRFNTKKRSIPLRVRCYNPNTGTVNSFRDVVDSTNPVASYDDLGDTGFVILGSITGTAGSGAINIQAHFTADAEL